MTEDNKTYQITLSLDKHLKDNKYFDYKDVPSINKDILRTWDTDFRRAISADLKSAYKTVTCDFISSEFELESEDDQGACVYFHRVVISDASTLEFIRATIKTLVNDQKTNIYLDNSYSAIDAWTGESVVLADIFTKLKKADKKSGNFFPLQWADFVT